MKKIIKFYRRRNYGVDHEYISDKADAAIVQQLTGQKTINGRIRELLRDLTGGMLGFQEEVGP